MAAYAEAVTDQHAPAPQPPTLRDRKRARVRQALVDAATGLFARDGYEQTTIADITAAAEVGARTFFNYFASKEDLLFPESDERVQATLDAIAARGPDEGPAEVLLRALRGVGAVSDEMASPQAALRLKLVRTVPAVRGRALQIQLDAQREIAHHLAAAYPDTLDEVTAAAVTGAFIGAITAALQVLLEDSDRPDDPAEFHRVLAEATDLALAPWMAKRG
ncbi:AcrR family transcriptional regulator [Catenulispora sp. MAP12-49]|uniref:TetR/AcrR family transcriptional regulator n=1 Tax=Catenulispora sp. MAP12-49 TaxID=3156302 RepID=UPI003513FD1E